MRKSRAVLLGLACAGGVLAHAQRNAPVNGVRTTDGPATAFVHATVHSAPGETLRDATVVIQGGTIIAVGARIEVPTGAIVFDLHGLHLWPALVEPYSDVGMPDRKAGERKEGRDDRDAGARFWNRAIRASTRADRSFTVEEDKAAALRAQGFGTVITHRRDGIARGTACAVDLAGRTVAQDIIVPQVSANFSFRKGSSPDDYPSSLMGSIALLRQTFYDARWYAGEGHAEQSDVELEALNEQLALPLVFEASDRYDVSRIARIGQEFGLSFIVKGNGDEYARLGDILETHQPLIVPLALPAAYDVEDPSEALEVSLAQLKHWELAPTNAQRISEAGGTFCFTTQGLKEPGEMWSSLRRMVASGLDSAAAIAALTTTPARIYGLQDRVGRIQPGMLADLVISSGHLLGDKNIIHETWVEGRRFVVNAYDAPDPRATYDLLINGSMLKLRITGERARPEARVSMPAKDSTSAKASLGMEGGTVVLSFDGRKVGFPGEVRLSGTIHPGASIWSGEGVLPDGNWVAWSAVKQQGVVNKERKRDLSENLDSLWKAPVGEVWYPMGGYGRPLLPDTENVVFRNATVWTNGPQGVLPKADVLISGGRVLAVAERIDVATAFSGKRHEEVREVDATGKHLTCGIIDEHSHIAIARGVNEGGQAVAAEVRIGDVIDPDDIDIYRDLSGGVTAVQQLHGSADPIGGQSSLIKLRWGQNADAMHIAGSSGFIKFALGENVKQSNWGTGGSRFPQTRMGVEQVMIDAFTRAKEYARTWAAFDKESPAPAMRKRKERIEVPRPSPRRDLELDALSEILRGERFITCHSYVQSEINMLIRVADSMGFKVNTFTHILEGYKVARELKAHGANASTFSDWWAYKYEVNDAIPYNAAIMQEQGLNVCINSDDAEMSRRLNQEAAKTVKYGNVAPEDAWKMVTLNPAKTLHLDARMGSIEPGKDADVVLWSANPLSIDAKAEMTFVDGVRRFDLIADSLQRDAMRVERERIIAKMIAAKKGGEPARKGERKEHREWRCETLGERP